MHRVPGGDNGILRQYVAVTAGGILTRPEVADTRYCSSLMRTAWALAHLLMLQAITLQATAKHTLARRRTRRCPIPCARLSSEFVASIPARILYRSLHRAVCWSAYISSLRRSSAVTSRRKSPEVSRGAKGTSRNQETRFPSARSPRVPFRDYIREHQFQSLRVQGFHGTMIGTIFPKAAMIQPCFRLFLTINRHSLYYR
jgi:hypothetical protein